MHEYKKNKLKFAIRITLASTSTVIKVAKYCNTTDKKISIYRIFMNKLSKQAEVMEKLQSICILERGSVKGDLP